EENYPDMKVLGKLSDVIGIRWFHLADLEFNDQYVYPYMMMARNDLDQPLSISQDSLVNFNKEIANAYKAGVGLKYLDSFLNDKSASTSIKEFFNTYKLKEVDSEDFVQILKENADKNIDWFYEDYIKTDEKIDFKIKNARLKGDSIEVTIKNKTENHMPVSLYGLKNNRIVFKTWVEQVYDEKTVKIPAGNIERVALNYEGIIPEINQRDNFYGVTTFFDKPVQFRLFKDVEDPHFNQVFFMPEVEYNLYDGLVFGPKIYNETILPKNFEYTIAPMYGSKSQTLVGGASFSHVIQFHDQELYAIRYGASASRFSYGYNLFYEKLTPFFTLSFRDANLRDNKRQMLMVRNVNVYRDQNIINPFDAPNYSVFNINYSYSDPGMVDYFTGNTDFQLAQQFSKFSVTMEYRKLFKNNRQINLRFFGGAFIYNDLTDSNYFSFALDRPTDYLYDYNYYGRSETSGLFSQQIIMAEGGFKSQLEPEFANQWLTSVNASTNIWKWVYAYGDVGLVKNKTKKAKFMYDSGIRLSFIADYFEIYFPVYSNLGWEISQENYDERIRFIATLKISALIKLFSREWY
ncbi:MAG TPA: metalloprotease, partial [Salinimicrobium sp.]|nr:metalloprotease [Salinimicrobium sp.]